MARGRSTGLGWAIASVFMGILFVFSLLFAIIFYTQVSEAEQAAERATSELRTYVRGNEKAEVQELDLEGNSVYGHMKSQLANLKEIAVGVSNTSVEEIQSTANVLVPSGGGLVNALQQAKADQRSDQQLIQELTAARDQAQQQLKVAQQQKTQATNTFNQAVNDLQAQLSQEQQRFASYQGNVNEQKGSLEQQMAEVREQAQAQAAALQSQTETLEKEIQRMSQVIEELREKLGGDEFVVDQATKVDGEIAALLSADDLVLLTLGRVDQVVLGMTFEVFPANSVIEADDIGRVRGDATVEVINISERSSTARVVRSRRGYAPQQGDLLVNAAYDPDQTYKFHVFGNFDLENSGEATVTGRRRVESLVTNWGARVVPQLTYDVDFLLLGEEPPVPEPLQPGETDPIVIATTNRAIAVRQQYESLISEAKALSIPILNQNRFLSLIGYYQR